MTDEDELRERVAGFVRTNFPQIELHGGSFDVQGLDPEAGEVTILLSGACDGCGVSSLTENALAARLPAEITELSTVHVETGMGDDPRAVQEDFSDVPF